MSTNELSCAYCGRPVIEKAPKIWVHVDDGCLYCNPFDSTNKGLALPVQTSSS